MKSDDCSIGGAACVSSSSSNWVEVVDKRTLRRLRRESGDRTCCDTENSNTRGTCRQRGRVKSVICVDESKQAVDDYAPEDRDVNPNEDLAAAIHASKEDDNEREKEARLAEASLARAMDESRLDESERRRRLDLLEQTDDEALALALKLSKQHAQQSDYDDQRQLEAALEMSAQEAATLAECNQDEKRLLEAALRRSLAPQTTTPPPGLGPLGTPSTESTLSRPARLLTPRQVILDEDNDDSQLELALHLSEQVESLERVLDADEDAEALCFAIAASRAHDASRRP